MSTICRLCLRNDNHITKENIFDLFMCDTLYWTFNVEVNIDDEFSKLICSKCLKLVNYVSKLKNFFQMNQYLLIERKCPLDFDIEVVDLTIDVGTQTDILEEVLESTGIKITLETLRALNHPIVEIDRLRKKTIDDCCNRTTPHCNVNTKDNNSHLAKKRKRNYVKKQQKKTPTSLDLSPPILKNMCVTVNKTEEVLGTSEYVGLMDIMVPFDGSLNEELDREETENTDDNHDPLDVPETTEEQDRTIVNTIEPKNALNRTEHVPSIFSFAENVVSGAVTVITKKVECADFIENINALVAAGDKKKVSGDEDAVTNSLENESVPDRLSENTSENTAMVNTVQKSTQCVTRINPINEFKLVKESDLTEILMVGEKSLQNAPKVVETCTEDTTKRAESVVDKSCYSTSVDVGLVKPKENRVVSKNKQRQKKKNIFKRVMRNVINGSIPFPRFKRRILKKSAKTTPQVGAASSAEKDVSQLESSPYFVRLANLNEKPATSSTETPVIKKTLQAKTCMKCGRIFKTKNLLKKHFDDEHKKSKTKKSSKKKPRGLLDPKCISKMQEVLMGGIVKPLANKKRLGRKKILSTEIIEIDDDDDVVFCGEAATETTASDVKVKRVNRNGPRGEGSTLITAEIIELVEDDDDIFCDEVSRNDGSGRTPPATAKGAFTDDDTFIVDHREKTVEESTSSSATITRLVGPGEETVEVLIPSSATITRLVERGEKTVEESSLRSAAITHIIGRGERTVEESTPRSATATHIIGRGERTVDESTPRCAISTRLVERGEETVDESTPSSAAITRLLERGEKTVEESSPRSAAITHIIGRGERTVEESTSRSATTTCLVVRGGKIVEESTPRSAATAHLVERGEEIVDESTRSSATTSHIIGRGEKTIEELTPRSAATTRLVERGEETVEDLIPPRSVATTPIVVHGERTVEVSTSTHIAGRAGRTTEKTATSTRVVRRDKKTVEKTATGPATTMFVAPKVISKRTLTGQKVWIPYKKTVLAIPNKATSTTLESHDVLTVVIEKNSSATKTEGVDSSDNPNRQGVATSLSIDKERRPVVKVPDVLLFPEVIDNTNSSYEHNYSSNFGLPSEVNDSKDTQTLYLIKETKYEIESWKKIQAVLFEVITAGTSAMEEQYDIVTNKLKSVAASGR